MRGKEGDRERVNEKKIDSVFLCEREGEREKKEKRESESEKE